MFSRLFFPVIEAPRTRQKSRSVLPDAVGPPADGERRTFSPSFLGSEDKRSAKTATPFFCLDLPNQKWEYVFGLDLQKKMGICFLFGSPKKSGI